MGRKHASALALLLAACAVTGASAALKTVHLGAAAAAPPHAPDRMVAARRAALDRFATSLARARRSRPPALPRVPHYAPVQIPAAPPAAPVLASAPLPAPAPAPKVRYVRPAPVVTTVQAPASRPSSWGGDDGGSNDDSGSGGDDGGGD